MVTALGSPARELMAEVRKLSRRPAVRVLTAIAVLSVPGLYALLALSIAASAGQPGLARQVARLEPAEFQWMIVTNLQQMYFVFAVVLGGLAIGEEFTSRTWKTLFTIQPPRVEVVGIKVGALVIFVAVWAAVLLATAAVSSEITARAEGLRSGWPPPGTVAGALGATFLILLVWATLAAMIAAITRRAAVGIAVAFLVATASAYGPRIAGLPGAAAAALSGSFMPDGRLDLAVVAHATMLLSVYGAVFVAIAIVLLQRQDITD